MIGLRFRNGMPPSVTRELDAFSASLRAFLGIAHNADGTLKQQVTATVSSVGFPVGIYIPYGGSIAPSGWLICDGSAISRSTYKTLFDVLGTSWGVGDGSTTFNIPDLRERFVIGKAAAGAAAVLGALGGSFDHTHSGPSHTHTVPNQAAHTHPISSDGTGNTGAPSGTTVVQSGVGATVASDVHTHAGPSHDHSGATGSGGSHDHGGATGAAGAGNTGSANPPYGVGNYIILVH